MAVRRQPVVEPRTSLGGSPCRNLTKLREKRAAGENGFTLIELLVVVVIIGVLIAIAIPVYLNYRKGAGDKSAQSDLRDAVNVVEQCYTDNASIRQSRARRGRHHYRHQLHEPEVNLE